MSSMYIRYKKVKVGNDQETEQSERNSHSKNRDGEKSNMTKLTISYRCTYTKKTYIVSRVSSRVGAKQNHRENLEQKKNTS